MADKCLSEQELGEDGWGSIRLPCTQFPSPAAPESFGNQQNSVFNEATQSFIMQGQCTETLRWRESPAAEIRARVPESEQGEGDGAQQEDHGFSAVKSVNHHSSLSYDFSP